MESVEPVAMQTPSVVEPSIPSAPRMCKLFLRRKRRQCKFACVQDSNFCHFHVLEDAREREGLAIEDDKQSQQEGSVTSGKQSNKNSSNSNNNRYVPCPLDPNHTVELDKLEKHLKICQAGKQQTVTESSIWFSKGINGSSGSFTSDNQAMRARSHLLHTLYANQDSGLTSLIEKIKKCFTTVVRIYKERSGITDMSEEELYAYLLDEEADNADSEQIVKKFKVENQAFSDTQRDHRQVIKMTQVLTAEGLAESNHIFIEFGAGKGLLSHGIAMALTTVAQGKTELTPEALIESLREGSINAKGKRLSGGQGEVNQGEDEAVCNQEEDKEVSVVKACHVLLELESRRNKLDRLHRGNPYFLRYRTDILDFNVNSLQTILKGKEYPHAETLRVVGVSKHMCGAATDLSINTLLNCETPQRFEGMMIATCCHHRCTVDTYTNVKFLQEIGFESHEMSLLFNCSSWYSSGQIKEEIMNKAAGKQQQQVDEVELEVEKEKEKKHKDWLSSKEKSVVGKIVKRTLDIGRILNLIEKGKQGKLVKYCDFVLSPENFVVIAK